MFRIIKIIIIIILCLTIKSDAQVVHYDLDSLVKHNNKNHYYKKSILHIDTIINPFIIKKPSVCIKGLDCSMWQKGIKWHLVDSNFTFVFIKATQNLRTDINFKNNWEKCSIPKGAYHFFAPTINGETQAKHFLSVVKIEKGDLPPVIDVEYTRLWRRCNRYTAVKNLKLMLDYIEKETGVVPIIYTNCGFWNKYIYNYTKWEISKYPLWVANYYVEKPKIPLGWEKWTFWQYTPYGKISHHHTDWDMNFYNGEDLTDIMIK